MLSHELCNVVLIMSVCSGLYIPSARKVIERTWLIPLGRGLCILSMVLLPIFDITIVSPIRYCEASVVVKFFVYISGVACSTILFKVYYINLNRSRIEHLFHVWDTTLSDGLYPDLKKKIFIETKKVTDRWIIIYGTIFVASVAIYGITPLIIQRLDHLTILPYTDRGLSFQIVATFEFVTQHLGCTILHVYNSLFLQFVAYIYAEALYLKESLTIILSSLKVGERGDITYRDDLDAHGGDAGYVYAGKKSYGKICEEVDRKLGVWIRQHQNLISYTGEMCDVFHLPLSVDFAGLAVLICLVCFTIINGWLTANQIFVCVIFCINSYTIFYVTCYYGDLAAIVSGNLFQDALGESWYVYPRKVRAALQIITTRCRMPLKLMAFVLYPLGSGSFAKIFKHSYSFFMFLMQVINRGPKT